MASIQGSISNSGTWYIRANYTYTSDSRTLVFDTLNGQRSNYLSRGNGTLTIYVYNNATNALIWSYTDYITMEFAKAAWSTSYWLHDGRGQNITIPAGCTAVIVKMSTTSDAFNSYI